MTPEQQLRDVRQKRKSRKQLCAIRKYWHKLNKGRIKRLTLSQAMYKWCESGKAGQFEIDFKKDEGE